jgi:hypothetical protein
MKTKTKKQEMFDMESLINKDPIMFGKSLSNYYKSTSVFKGVNTQKISQGSKSRMNGFR